MSRKIIGNTVGTPIKPQAVLHKNKEEILKLFGPLDIECYLDPANLVVDRVGQYFAEIKEAHEAGRIVRLVCSVPGVLFKFIAPIVYIDEKGAAFTMVINEDFGLGRHVYYLHVGIGVDSFNSNLIALD